MNTDANEPVPEGFNVPYEYYDPDDMCRRSDIAHERDDSGRGRARTPCGWTDQPHDGEHRHNEHRPHRVPSSRPSTQSASNVC